MCALEACRMCISVDKRMCSIAGTPLQDIYERITNIQLENNDGVPVLVCNMCLHMLQKCGTFIEHVVRADEALRRVCSEGSELSKTPRLAADAASLPASLSMSVVISAWYDPCAEPADVEVKAEIDDEVEAEELEATGTHDLSIASDSVEIPTTAHCDVTRQVDEMEEMDEETTGIDMAMVLSDPLEVKARPCGWESEEEPPLLGFTPDDKREGGTPERGDAPPRALGKGLRVMNRSKMKKADKQVTTSRNKAKIVCRSAVKKELKINSADNVDEKSKYNGYSADKMENNGKKVYPCTVCSRIYNNRCSLVSHLKTHEEKSYLCHICSRGFHRKNRLEIHFRTHTGEKPCQCPYCDKTFRQSSILIRHVRTHTGEKPYQCSQCGKGFIQKNNLENHMRSHTGDRPYQCPQCGKTFILEFVLINHMRTHTGEKPFQCNYCDKAFRARGDLNNHIRTHTGERPYQCNVCNRAFKRLSNLKEHIIVTHTKERPYKCMHCSKAFHSNGLLNTHMRLHTGEKPFQCAHCGAFFRQKTVLRTHIIRHMRNSLFL